MSNRHKMKWTVEEDPEWFLGGVPLPPKLASKWRGQPAQEKKEKMARAKQKAAARRHELRKVLREMAYSTDE